MFTCGEQLFSCEVSITLSSGQDRKFGSRTVSSPSKKSAKSKAAMEAIKWLRETGQLDEARTPRKKQNALSSSVNRSETDYGELKSPEDALPIASPNNTPGNETFVSQVSVLARRLGIREPLYVNVPSDPQIQGFWNCSASFPGDPKFPGSIGEVHNVLGKKTAKEECARWVWEYLKEIEAERMQKKNAFLAAMAEKARAQEAQQA
ncbi:hypothetical protein EJ05DRAFT_364511 [Pseudovirgaria hyperparasitica]|uniref:Dicer dsRNA-binding fold domain-containing protein n=1 Tax=Pseudovirgaria hyperparasitica TaxID=470096 RepID=A0A6A6WA21_9PEZI|nr:uncharacterized protein EJ05DRAFT_364511 [Pseudovirgaria hyperparasitica]KAF2758800.1 hypothetical protein EJ05DRAFT_364511 [Pseudovirgaria hyperparasitica]